MEFLETLMTPVKEDADVVVIGGGPSGVAAAIAAARHNAKVILIEKTVILGGLATNGNVCFYEPLCDGKGRQISAGLVEELFYRSIQYSYNTVPPIWQRGRHVAAPAGDTHEDAFEASFLPKRNWSRYHTLFNVPAFALALEESVLEAGVNILYDTQFCKTIVENGHCVGVVVENISGRYAISCKVLIDASGSAIAFQSAGGKCSTRGNNFTSTFFDTDFEKMKIAIHENNVRKAINWRFSGYMPLKSKEKDRPFRGDTAEGVNEYIRLSHATTLAYLKEHQGPDYAILALPSAPQIRYIRHIEGRTPMLAESVFQSVANSVGCVSDWRKPGPIYEVPYTCMLSPDFTNMAAVGRNIAADDDMWDLMRCYPGGITTGQAAGVAAAIAVAQKVELDQVDIPLLQDTLRKDGVRIHLEDLGYEQAVPQEPTC